MTEFEESAEAAHDLIREKLLRKNDEDGSRWMGWIILSTMALALFSALAALLAGFTANEAVLERTKEILEVSYYESDRLNIEVLKSKHEILASLGDTPKRAEIDRIRKYEDEMSKLELEVAKEELKTKDAMFEHELFAIGVTLFSIAITLSGMAMVAQRRMIWGVGLVFGLVGICVVAFGIFKMFS